MRVAAQKRSVQQDGVARSRATVMRWLTVAAKLLIRELVVCTQLIQGPTSVSAAAARTMTAQTSLFKLNGVNENQLSGRELPRSQRAEKVKPARELAPERARSQN